MRLLQSKKPRYVAWEKVMSKKKRGHIDFVLYLPLIFVANYGDVATINATRLSCSVYWSDLLTYFFHFFKIPFKNGQVNFKVKDNKKVGAKVLKIAIMGHFAKTKSLLYQVT